MSDMRLTAETMERFTARGPVSGDEMATLTGLVGEMPPVVMTPRGNWIKADDGSYELERSSSRIPPHDPSALEYKRFGW